MPFLGYELIVFLLSSQFLLLFHHLLFHHSRFEYLLRLFVLEPPLIYLFLTTLMIMFLLLSYFLYVGLTRGGVERV